MKCFKYLKTLKKTPLNFKIIFSKSENIEIRLVHKINLYPENIILLYNLL